VKDSDVQRHVDDLERQCLESLDPFAHFVLLDSVDTFNPLPFAISDKITGETISDHPISDVIRLSESKRQDSVKALKRVFRYFSSETLVLMLLSGRPLGPFVRLSNVLRGKKLDDTFKSIARKEVPEGFALKFEGQPLSFEKWISERITADPDWLSENGSGQIADLIVEEAAMLSNRGTINAFKHCRPFSHANSPEVVATPKDGERRPLNETLNGINWMEWKENQDTITLSYLSEEIEDGHDQQRLFSIGLLLDSLKRLRLAQLGGAVENFELILPTDMKTGLRVRHQKIAIKYASSESVETLHGANE